MERRFKRRSWRFGRTFSTEPSEGGALYCVGKQLQGVGAQIFSRPPPEQPVHRGTLPALLPLPDAFLATPAQEPQRFGKYQIVERIAAGGMAEIFKARLDGIGGFHRTFAIKRILPHLTTNPEFVDMLVDEAKIAGLLSHANIVQTKPWPKPTPLTQHT